MLARLNELADPATWRRKLNTLRSDPAGVVEARLRHWTSRPLERHAHWELDRRGLLEPFANRPSGAFPAHYTDLWFLYRAVRQRKPQLVIEYGSGCSTTVIAQGLLDNRQGRIVSYDAIDRWAEVTRESVPTHLREICEVVTSSLSTIDVNGTPWFVHDACPDDSAPDLVYVDGPPLSPEVRGAADVIRFEDRLPPGFMMVVDGRWDNVAMLRRGLQRKYRYRKRWPYNNSVFELAR